MLQGLIQFFNFFNVLFIGTGLSIFVVSFFIYKPFNEEDYESDTNEDDFYEYKYLHEYYDLIDKNNSNDNELSENESNDTNDIILENNEENINLLNYENKEEIEKREKEEIDIKLNSIKDQFIEENTPRGVVFMTYDKDNNFFIYYSKTKDLPFNYLETVGRKFVIDYNCPEIFIDYNQEYQNAINKKYLKFIESRKEQLENLNEENQKNENDKNNKKNVFAVFKNYNKTEPVEKNVNNNVILTEKCNVYKYKGNLIDYENLIKKNEILEHDYENIDFKTYKELQKKEK